MSDGRHGCRHFNHLCIPSAGCEGDQDERNKIHIPGNVLCFRNRTMSVDYSWTYDKRCSGTSGQFFHIAVIFHHSDLQDQI